MDRIKAKKLPAATENKIAQPAREKKSLLDHRCPDSDELSVFKLFTRYN